MMSIAAERKYALCIASVPISFFQNSIYDFNIYSSNVNINTNLFIGTAWGQDIVFTLVAASGRDHLGRTLLPRMMIIIILQYIKYAHMKEHHFCKQQRPLYALSKKKK